MVLLINRLIKLHGGSTVADSKRVELEVGDRVKMSALGSERSPLLVRKVGTITGLRRHSSTIFVRFDGNKRATTLHRDYVEPIEA